MPHNRKAYLPVPTVTALLRGLTRQAARYAAQVRTLRAIARLRAQQETDAPRPTVGPPELIAPIATADMEVVAELLTLIRDQQAQLIVAAQRIGALEAQLAAGLTPEQARALREELAECQAQRAAQPHAPQRETVKQKKRKKVKKGSI